MTWLDPEMTALFREECETHMQALTDGFLSLEAQPDQQALLEHMFRAAHSFKGAARMVGLEALAEVAHVLEDLLDQLRAGRLRLAPDRYDVLAGVLQRLPALVDGALRGETGEAAPLKALLGKVLTGETSVETQGDTPATQTAQPSGQPADPAQEVLRIPSTRLDHMVGLLADLAGGQERLRRYADDAEALQQTLDQSHQAGAGGRDAAWDGLERRARELALGLRDEQGRAEAAFHALEDALRRLRLVPIEQVLTRVPHLVRDLARRTGKQVEVTLRGGDTSVDKRLIDGLQEPLVHLLANAIDHGLEMPEERAASGKPAAGQVRVEALRTADGVLLVVEDDGRGVDLEAVRRLAVSRGHLRQTEAAALDDAALLRLLLLPGWTTRSAVSALSGRGVGLDAVQTQVTALRGTLDIRSTRGKGTRFELRFPSRMTTLSVLVVRVGREHLGLPSGAVRACLGVPARGRTRLGGREAVEHAGEIVPVASLGRVIGLAGDVGAASSLLVLVEDRGRCFAFEVDDLLSERELVQKPLPRRVRGRVGVGSVAVLGDGALCLLLQPDVLLAAAELTGATQGRPEPTRRRRLLVVDDSLTTRAQLRRILESDGYDVTLAVDGVDAWAKLETQSFDALVSDVEMPNLGGLGLVEKVRAHSGTARLPVILCTTLASDEDRRRGLDAGANAYLTKGGFDQSVLLASLQGLL